MPDITYDDKVAGDQVTPADMNQIKAATNSKADAAVTAAALSAIDAALAGISGATEYGIERLADADAAAAREGLELENVDNTSDANKPVSTAQAAALALKANASAISNVNNTSDANKPVSTAQQAALDLKANLASPGLTGTPTAPTAAADTNTTQIATTAYVQGELGDRAPLASPAFTGTPTVPTAAPGTNTTQAASTAFVAALGALKANLASPALTGTPTVPTAAPGTNSTQAASTAFVAALGALKLNITDISAQVAALVADGHLLMRDGAALAGTPLVASSDNTVWDYLTGASGLTDTAALQSNVGRYRTVAKVADGSTDVVTLSLATAASPALSVNVSSTIAQAVEIEFVIPEAAITNIERPLMGRLRLINSTATPRAVTLAVAESGKMAQVWSPGAEALAIVPANKKLMLAWSFEHGMGAAGANVILWNYVMAQP